MNWMTFLAALGGIYVLYYSVLVAADLMAKPAEQAGIVPQMVVEGFEPEKVLLEDAFPSVLVTSALSITPTSIALGGVSLKEVFELSRAKALEYTRPVSF